MMTNEDTRERKPKGFIRFRYLFAIVCMAGMTVRFSASVSYQLATKALYKKHNSSSYSSNSSFHSMGNIETQQNLIMPAYYLGFGLASIPGGRLVELYSAKWASAIASVTCATIFGLSYQVYSFDNLPLLLLLRLIEGISAAVLFPALAVLTARWSPPAERYIVCGITYCGIYLGAAIGLFSTTWITRKQKDSPLILFALNAFLTILWLIFHIIYIEDYPQLRTRLNIEERNFIVSSLKEQLYDPAVNRKSRVPWRQIFKSGPFLSLIAVHFAIRMIYHVNLTRTMAGYRWFRWKTDMTNFNQAIVKSSAYFWGAVMAVTLGLVFSTLYHQRAMSKAGAVKIATITGLLLPVILLFVDYFGGSNWELTAKPLLCILLAGITNTVMINHIELSPNYAGTLLGITTAIGTVNWFILQDYLDGRYNNTVKLILYCITAVISLAAMLIYYFLHSTEVQPWNQNLKEEIIEE